MFAGGGLRKHILADSIRRCWFWLRVNLGDVCAGESSGSILQGVMPKEGACMWGGSALGAEGVCVALMLALRWDTGNNCLVEGSSQVYRGTRLELGD